MDRTGGIGISEEHVALRDTARRWTASHCPPSVPRAALDAEAEALPPFWTELGELGWFGLHLPEADGGQGYGIAELAIVLEELGRACAPGPFLPTVVAAAALDRFGTSGLHRSLLGDIAAGRVVVGMGGCPSLEVGDGAVTGTWDAVPGAGLADVLLLPLPAEDGERWITLDAGAVTVEPQASLDRTRRVARVTASGVRLDPDRIVGSPAGPAGVSGLGVLLHSAEAVGMAAWCVECAADYAKVREQFGRPIGQFQGVKHRCADMLCALEQARAAVWDATNQRGDDSDPLAIAVAGALAPEAAYRCAKDAIQVLGGIGFTWEHDAHLYLKRAAAKRLSLGGPGHWRLAAGQLALAGSRRDLSVELPPEAEHHRTEVRAFLDELQSVDKSEWNRRIADAGYLSPHWPEPWGRDAGPLEQLVIDEEFQRARVRRMHLAVGGWALPTIIVHGTADQQERFVPPTLRGELTWCQMFSEPGAGSDLASLSTKAIRTDGGWLLSGQKVWTSMAHIADWGICLARTDPSVGKHEGIGCFLVDMRTEGIEVRPLRELTGFEMFNEVFLSDVFVPDECVVGAPTAGWEAARTTLGNERVSMGRGSSMGPGVESLLELVAALDDPGPQLVDTIGAVVAATQSVAAMGMRMTLRALSGAAPGPEASIRKLVGVELDQWVQEVALDVLGPSAVAAEGDAAGWIGGFLGNRSLSIAGGTSEIQRNVIAERLLGLPRDP